MGPEYQLRKAQNHHQELKSPNHLLRIPYSLNTPNKNRKFHAPDKRNKEKIQTFSNPNVSDKEGTRFRIVKGPELLLELQIS